MAAKKFKHNTTYPFRGAAPLFTAGGGRSTPMARPTMPNEHVKPTMPNNPGPAKSSIWSTKDQPKKYTNGAVYYGDTTTNTRPPTQTTRDNTTIHNDGSVTRTPPTPQYVAPVSQGKAPAKATTNPITNPSRGTTDMRTNGIKYKPNMPATPCGATGYVKPVKAPLSSGMKGDVKDPKGMKPPAAPKSSGKYSY